jgi:calcium/calmodulin-dependent protein kinase I
MTMKCGTPGYIAPEILRSQGYTEKADIFSAGVIMYNLLTGRLLFSGNDVNEILAKNHRMSTTELKKKIMKLSQNSQNLLLSLLE